MKDLKKIYKPYNFSSNRCHLIEILIGTIGATKVEVRLPAYIKKLTGIYYTMAFHSEDRVLGLINLSFNDGADKISKHTVFNIKRLKHNSTPIPLNIELKNNSLMQGYFLTGIDIKEESVLKIYLHYK